MLSYTRGRMMMHHRDRMLLLACGVAGEMDDRDAVDRAFKSNHDTVCENYFRSLRFPENGKDDSGQAGGERMAKGLKAAILAAGIFLLASCVTADNGGWGMLRTENGAKTPGLNVQVSYPEYWVGEEDQKRSYVVKTFRRVENNMTEHLLLQVRDVGKNDAETLFGDEASFDVSPRKAKWLYLLSSVADAKTERLCATTLKDRPAVMADVSMTRPGRAYKVYVSSRLMMVHDKNRILTLTCGVNGSESDREAIDRRQTANADTVCRDYFSSLKLLE